MKSASKGKIRSVAILGGGPAASVLATQLSRAGIRTGIFHRPKKSPLLVGESLVPAIIPLLRLMGIEDQVRDFSMYKPGATINMSEKVNFVFPFANLLGNLPRYAYNVPRDLFDKALLDAARQAGTHIIEAPAVVERIPGTDGVRLTADSLKAAGDFFSSPPDFIVDATGRVRVLPKLMEIPCKEGGRHDTALFAHVDNASLENEGHVHTTRLDHGWSWRIPLPGRVSIGIVIGSEFLPKFGATQDERYDNLLRQDSVLKRVASQSKRLTPVMEYSNYQLVSTRIVGDGWALVGDSAGFIDPVFSSGLFIGMQSAIELAETIRNGSPEAFAMYEKHVVHHLESWHEIVEYFYNGRLFTCFHVGNVLQDNLLVRLTFPHLSKHFGRIFSGAASTSAYSLGLLRFAMKYGLKNENPDDLRIH